MIRKRLALLGVISTILIYVLAGSLPARAASIYDDAYQTTETLKTSMSAGILPNTKCPAVDLSTSWAGLILDEDKWNSGTASSADRYSQALQDALDHGAWAVSEAKILPGTPYSQVTAMWSTSPATLSWSANEVLFSSSTEVFKVSFMVNSRCEPEVTGINLTGNLIASSGYMSVKNFLTAGDVDFNYPTNYGGEVINETYTPPTATYVAMGDSFSSGEGNEPFLSGTDVNNTNGCHRSRKAYPLWLGTDTNLNLGPVNFIACSGATTQNILYGGSGVGSWNEQPQINSLTQDTEVVTITIGGNDVGFAEYAYACTIKLCGPGTFDYNYIMSAINDTAFHNSLVQTYRSILSEAPQAQLYVADYPYLAASISDVCEATDLTGAWSVQKELNSVIHSAVAQARLFSQNIHLVETNGTNSPFNGKHLCNGGEEAFNRGVPPPNDEYSFHPSQLGQQLYAQIFKSAIN